MYGVREMLKERDQFVLDFVAKNPGCMVQDIGEAWRAEHPEYYLRSNDPVVNARHHVSRTLSSLLKYRYVRREGKPRQHTYFKVDERWHYR